MGDAKKRREREQHNQQEFLRQHTVCCYCGTPATTVDHCPPRALFVDRKWPETMEFPCCAPCNAKDRQAEQVVTVLLKPSLKSDGRDPAWERTLNSLRHNRPDLFDEWTLLSRNEMRRRFHEKFGREMGDRLRQAEYGVLHIGPLTTGLLEDWCLKLGQALFYKAMGRRCTGRVWVLRVDMLNATADFQRLVDITPNVFISKRGGQDLSEQFRFRYMADVGQGILFALATAREQFGVMITAMDEPSATTFAGMSMAPRMRCLVCPP